MILFFKRRWIPLFLLGALLPCQSLQAGGEAPSEYQVKAAFLYNFAKFVEWPPDTFKSTDASFVIGILGDDPFGAELSNALEGKTVQERKITLIHLSRAQDAVNCHVLFISTSEESHLRAVLAALKSGPVLTVSDMARFIEKGGMVGFSLENSRIRFSINKAAAELAGLKISSQLLKLAKAVK